MSINSARLIVTALGPNQRSAASYTHIHSLTLTVGSIGSLLSVQLARCTNNNVRLVLRSLDSLKRVGCREDNPSIPVKPIIIERDGDQLYPATTLEVEALPHERWLKLTHPKSSPEVHERAQPKQPMGMIDSLFVTTKAPQVLPALRSMLPRLTPNSTIVLLQNGAGLVESLVRNLFQDASLRPNFVIGVNSHGANVADYGRRYKPTAVPLKEGEVDPTTMRTIWAGVGSLPFCVIPNEHVRRAIQDSTPPTSTTVNPLLNPLSRTPPDLSNLPITPATASLHTTVSALLACTPLNTSWLPVSDLLSLQLQKVAVNCIINPLTAIFDVQNGLIWDANARRVGYRIAKEASDVFVAQLKRNIELQQQHHQQAGGGHVSSGSSGTSTSTSGSYNNPATVQAMAELSPQGTFYPGHPLHPDMLLEKALEVARKTHKNVSSTLSDIRTGKAETEM